ncbi:hypothetical protein PHET_00591 [Paragonimus heterotremus]|uniref:Uncharacterized protein n=1 Tax=Paragonimus heterotremus TaxID=100268 RepID=A0A8J4WV50_9TREM|nr:hypothetical protein PHET_00591 [Paragonimus heterotremus]
MGVLIFVTITLCCQCRNKFVGIVGIVCGSLTLILTIIAYVTDNTKNILRNKLLPLESEWIFGGILISIGMILLAITVAVIDRYRRISGYAT